ncbi:MAG TPA: hypothetical protein VGG44_10010 [Tepidisphaeraceae bacterium]|jgi:hypothetical protein
MLQSIFVAIGLFAALVAGLEVGRWLGRRQQTSEADKSADFGPANGVVFAVLGLMIAFTFTTSASRFDERRKLIIDQANALGTAWMRTDLLASSDRESVRRPMRQWVKLTLEVLPIAADEDPITLQHQVENIRQLQDETWQAAVAAFDRPTHPQNESFVLSPINDWIAFSSTRMEMSNRGLPPMVLSTLIILAIAAAVLAGFNMAKRTRRSPLHMLLFAGTIAFSIYVIIDLNHPRSGLIRVDAADDAMKQVYATMSMDAPQPATQAANP